MLTVFNCGQGDAMRLAFPYCYWGRVPLYIDLGPSTFLGNIQESEIDLLLTHCHDDHVMGFSNLSTVKIRDLYLPAYVPEYCKILIKLARRCPKISIKNPRNTFVIYEGMNSFCCKHIQVYNPPLNPREIFEIDEFDESRIASFLERYGTSIESISESYSGFDFGIERPSGYESELFIRSAIQRMISIPREDGVDELTQFIKHDSNKFSAVISYTNDHGDKYLLTGDATIPVFNRLMSNKVDLKSKILKVPHHGSRHSLNGSIISYISPEIAVISHNNGTFGPSKDPHPNLPVIKELAKRKIACFYTNDVLKNSAVIPKHIGLIPGVQVEIK